MVVATRELVSVLMPIYNEESYLSVAIDSILAQTYDNFEIVAVDDGSRDRSPEILRRYAKEDSRVKYVQHRENAGLVSCLQTAVEHARGNLFARMDGDDLSPPTRLARQVGYLSENRECVAVSGAIRYIDSYGRSIYERFNPKSHTEIEAMLLRGDGAAFLHGGCMMRRGAFESSGGYQKQYEFAEDVDLFLRMAMLGELANLDTVVLEYRLKPSGICFENQVAQFHKVNEILNDAHQARGITYESAALEIPQRDRTKADHFLYVSYRAARAGNLRCARVNGLQCVRHRPLSIRSWAVLMIAFAPWLLRIRDRVSRA